MRKNGFTMIELLVVMAIVGFLMTMGLSSYSRSLSRGRDAGRISDMKEIQKGFELFHAKSVTNSYSLDNDCQLMRDDDDVNGVFPSGIPTEDQPSHAPYVFTCDSTVGVESYCVCADVENDEDYANSGAACDFSAADPTHYCVANVQ